MTEQYRRDENIPDDGWQILKKHVTNLESNIYCLHDLPEEVIAVLFAYVSRSAKSFRENLYDLLKSGELADTSAEPEAASDTNLNHQEDYAAAAEKARKFHEKWVVGYGHASVAEHAHIKYAIDDISIHAAKFLENNRLGSYTEKSSRYQVFAPNSFIIPPELLDTEGEKAALRDEYVETCRGLFELYAELIEPLEKYMMEKFPLGEGKRERAWKASIKAKVCDVARYLLPASTLTSLGVSWNARSTEHAINKLLSSPCSEFQEIGQKMFDEGQKVCPALLKHVGVKGYFKTTPGKIADQVRELGIELDASDDYNVPNLENDVRLISDDPVAETRLVAALLFEQGATDWQTCWAKAAALSEAEQDRLIEVFFDGREKFDWPLRSMEHPMFAMEMVMDYGAYRDVQRHRMATLTEQETCCEHGYDVPYEIVEIGFEEQYHAIMEKAEAVYRKLKETLPQLAAYVVPQAYRKRILFTWNLRELEHFIRLRSGRQGHISYRKVAQAAHRLLVESHPRLAKYIQCDYDDYGLGRQAAEERTEAKREAMKP
jgi:thymidylate synthase ThyX